MWYNVLGNKRYELTNHLGDANVVITDRKTPQNNNYSYIFSTFNSTTEGWTAIAPATVTQSAGQLNVTTNSSVGTINKTFATTVGEEYDVVVNALKGTTPNIQFYINGTPYSITSGTTTGLTFTATATSTVISIRSTTSGSYTYSVQDILVNSHARYTANVVVKNDYYAFGYEMSSGRSVNSSSYRFGMSGYEKDNEISGNGNSLTTEFRQYDPRLGRWKSCDPLRAMYPSMSPYCYAGNMPVSAYDPDGRLIIFVNGFTGGYLAAAGLCDPSPPKKAYWGESGKFQDGAREFLGDQHIDDDVSYVDGSVGKFGGSTAKQRYRLGKEYAEKHFDEIKAALGKDEALNIVTHSMGGAYAEGMIEYFESKGLKVNVVVHLSTCDAYDIDVKNTKITRYQIGVDHDRTLFDRNRGADMYTNGKKRMIRGATMYGEYKAIPEHLDWLTAEEQKEAFGDHDFHADTKTYRVWKAVNELKNAKISKGTPNYYTNMYGEERLYYTFTVDKLSNYTWNALKINNSYFIKNMGDTDEPNKFKSIDLDAHTYKPCNVADW